MSYGTGSDGGKLTFFKINGLKKSSSPEDLYFAGRTKEDGKYVDLEVKPTYIEGYLTEVKTDSYEYEDDKINTIKFTLDDPDAGEKLVLETGYSNMAISLINTLAGSDNIKFVKMSLFTSKTGYPSMFTSFRDPVTEEEFDAKWKWDYKKDIAPKIESAKLGKKVIVDKTKLEEFLIAHINSQEFQDKFGKAKPYTPAAKPDSEADTFEKVDVKKGKKVADEDLGLPF